MGYMDELKLLIKAIQVGGFWLGFKRWQADRDARLVAENAARLAKNAAGLDANKDEKVVLFAPKLPPMPPGAVVVLLVLLTSGSYVGAGDKPTPTPVPAPTPIAIPAQYVSSLNSQRNSIAASEEHLRAEKANLESIVRQIALELHLNLDTHTVNIEIGKDGAMAFSVKPAPASTPAPAPNPEPK